MTKKERKELTPCESCGVYIEEGEEHVCDTDPDDPDDEYPF